jgi:HEAT repeat protein
VKKLVEYHINRLRDKNPEIRLKAIKELELLGDPDSLDALRSVYDSDNDVDVRKAAQSAGRAIFLRQQSSK